MSQAERLNDLRELMWSAPESDSARAVALIFSFALVVAVLWLVRRQRLREEYTPIWIGTAVAMALVSVHPEILRTLARLMSAWTLSSTVFFLGLVFLVAICLNYAVRLSRASLQIKNLAQEVALIGARLDRMSRQVSPGDRSNLPTDGAV